MHSQKLKDVNCEYVQAWGELQVNAEEEEGSPLYIFLLKSYMSTYAAQRNDVLPLKILHKVYINLGNALLKRNVEKALPFLDMLENVYFFQIVRPAVKDAAK